MGFLSNMLDPSNIKYSLPPGLGMLYGGTQGGGGGSAAPQSTALPYGVPWWLRSSQGQYPGVSSLLDILNNPGQTDSTMVNRMLSANSRNTQGQVDSARSGLATSGYGNSGLGLALQSAIQGQGADREAAIRANEARRREDLLRGDLGFLGDYFVNPKLQYYGINKGVQVQNDARRTAEKGAAIGGGASLLATLIPILAAACKTAEELYGPDAEETHLARFYMGHMADQETRDLYGSGEKLAARVRVDGSLRREVRQVFDSFVEDARAYLGGGHARPA